MEQITRFILLMAIFSTTMTACGDGAHGIGEGVYKRVYERDAGIYELVELRDNNIFRQQFFQDGKLRFENTGRWQFVPSNRGHSVKWRDGRSLIIFTEWVSAEELLRRERLSNLAGVSLLPKEEVVALVRDTRRFAFDEDGGSDYKQIK